MKVEQIKVDALIPYALNNMKHPEEQVNRIASSIQQFGFNVPLVVDKDNVVVAGHGRLLAAKKLGLGEVPCVRADHLTEAQVRAYRVLDNSLPRQGEWDTQNLAIEFDLLEEDGFDLASWGLDSLRPGPIPDFQPVSIDEQGKLDEKKKAMCPNCGHEFEPK